MVGYTVTIDDVDVTTKLVDSGFRISHGEMAVKRCAVKLYEQLYAMGDELKVWVGDTLRFQGDIEKENIVPGMFSAYAGDKLIILSDSSARDENHRQYANTEVSVIVKDLLNFYFSGEFDVTNVDTTTTTVGYLDLKDKPINECLTILANRAQYVFWLEPPNFFYFKEKDSVSSGYSAIYGTNIENLAITRDNFVKTKVIVRFKLPNEIGFVEVGTGTRTTIVADDTVVTEEDATQLGNAVLQEMQDIQIRGDITLVGTRHDLIPGTTCVLHAPQFGFNNETIRIKQVVYTPLTTRLTVGLMTALSEDTMVDFEERIKRMENRGIDWLGSCESSKQTAPGCAGECEVACEVACEVLATCVAACQAGPCQTNCQLVEQISCVTDEQVCGTEGTCQIACETGHKCDTICQSECKNACQTACQGNVCETACQSAVELACSTGCETTCQTACEIVGCEVVCQSACQTTCQSSCEGGCQSTCETTCQETCETACMVACEVEALCCGTIGPD